MDKIAKQLTIKYAFLQAAYWMSQCSISSFAAVYLKSKGFTNVKIGIVMALAAVLSIFLQPIIASFADNSKKLSLRHIVIIIMSTVYILCIALLLLPNSIILTGLIYVIINALQYTLIPLLNSLALEYINKGVLMNYGLARGSGSISFAVMSSSLGLLISYFGTDILLIVFLITYFFLILFSYIFKAEVPNNNDSPTIQSNVPVVKNISTGGLHFFIKYRKFSIQLIGISMLFYSFSMINTYQINIMENVGGNSTNMGISFAIAAALELPTMAAFVFLVKKIKCSTLLKISTLFFFIKAFFTLIAPNVLAVYFAMSLQLFAFALYTPASIYYVNSIIDDKDRVKGQAMLGVAGTGVASTLSSITSGKILDTYGVSRMLLIGTIVTAIGMIVMLLTTEDTGKIKTT